MGYRMKYTGEEVENRLEKVDAIENNLAEVSGKVDANAEAIAEVSGTVNANAEATSNDLAEINRKMDANTESIETLSGKVAEAEGKIAEVDEATKTNAEDVASLGGKVAEVEGKADANTENITEIGGKVTEIEGSITEINGSIDTLLEGVAAVESKADSNNKDIILLGSKFYVTDFTMDDVRAAAETGQLNFRVTNFFSAVIGGKLLYIRDTSSGGVSVPQTYVKSNKATAVIYDTVYSKWYTLTVSSTDRNITVTASDTVNLMANKIYTTNFTMQQLIAALGESDGATLSVSTEGFSKALGARKSILIPDANGGGYISLSGAYSNTAIFYVAGNKMFLTITVADAGTLNLRRRHFDATGYVDIESAYKLSGNDGQSGGAISEAMTQYKIQYRTTACPTFGIGGFPQLRVGQVLNLRFIFTAGLGAVTFYNNSNYKVVIDRATNTSNDVVPAIVDVTVINPAEGAQMVVFYTVKKYS